MTVTTATMGTLTTAGTPPAMPGIGTIPRGSLRLLLLRARAAEAGGIDIATGITRAEAEAGTDITTTRAGIIAGGAAAVGAATGAAPRRGGTAADSNPGRPEEQDPHSPRR